MLSVLQDQRKVGSVRRIIDQHFYEIKSSTSLVDALENIKSLCAPSQAIAIEAKNILEEMLSAVNKVKTLEGAEINLNAELWKRKAEELTRLKIVIPEVARGYEEIYERFLKGVLVYRPQEGSNVGKIEMPIADLANPLEGTFDLSRCGDTGKYLSIATGYRKGKKVENASKVEVWLAPRFLIERELQGPASHFAGIMGTWGTRTEPFGVFFTGGWNPLNYYDFAPLPRVNWHDANLHSVWSSLAPWAGPCPTNDCKKFYVHFVAPEVIIERPIRVAIPEVARGYEEIYERFLRGVLIYDPDPNSTL
ncbi:MAG: hypothetical protein JNJ47_08645, partial [Alphaproteobacteria bacterium]|nr:hypothetical protein [Alphaproteobacteria bacterium]